MPDTVPQEKQSTAPDKRLPFEQHASERTLAVWELPALAAFASWLPGQEVTLAQFDAAYKGLHSEVIE